MTTVAVDPVVEFLTQEQVVAAGTTLPRVFLEAAPGSGKTTVAAQRFGAQRYLRQAHSDGRADHRAVIAVSFTRSATWELNGRVRRGWGPSALTRLHRIVTLDTIVCDLLMRLLREGLVLWPGGHKQLQVHDSWKVLVRHAFMRADVGLQLVGNSVKISTAYTTAAMRPEPYPFTQAVQAGHCTHDDVRRVLGQSLKRADVADALLSYLSSTIRALIVDEVFDANELDIQVIELAIRAGLDVTLVGDPWQALYGFRGARPDLVPALLKRTGMTTLKLTKSFRWRTPNQQTLATALRAGEGVVLGVEPVSKVLAAGANVLLACRWEDLWNTAAFVLPLAWGSAKGNNVEAASTLLLNQVTQTVLGQQATYLGDALATLGITDTAAVERLEVHLQGVLERVAVASSKAELDAAYVALVKAVGTESGRDFPRPHAFYRKRLELLRARLVLGEQVIAGLTIHQAKGREWDVVALRLTEGEVDDLAAGLDSGSERHRQLYVACTRARHRAFRVVG